jgi:hypothetical protein
VNEGKGLSGQLSVSIDRDVAHILFTRPGVLKRFDEQLRKEFLRAQESVG